jgi:hypothetical protein
MLIAKDSEGRFRSHIEIPLVHNSLHNMQAIASRERLCSALYT